MLHHSADYDDIAKFCYQMNVYVTRLPNRVAKALLVEYNILSRFKMR